MLDLKTLLDLQQAVTRLKAEVLEKFAEGALGGEESHVGLPGPRERRPWIPDPPHPPRRQPRGRSPAPGAVDGCPLAGSPGGACETSFKSANDSLEITYEQIGVRPSSHSRSRTSSAQNRSRPAHCAAPWRFRGSNGAARRIQFDRRSEERIIKNRNSTTDLAVPIVTLSRLGS